MHFLTPLLLAAPTLTLAFRGIFEVSVPTHQNHKASPEAEAFLISYTERESAAYSPYPPAPCLTYLYTAYLETGPSISVGEGPKGLRSTIPITGGNFSGPLVGEGTIEPLGADWALIDSTNTLYADSRSNLRTSSGDEIYLQQSGTGGQGDGNTFLRMVFETGSKKYFWLNKAIAIGTLKFEEETAGGGSVFKIVCYMMKNCD